MSIDQLLGKARRVPVWGWVAAGAVALAWLTRPRGAAVPATPPGDEDVQVLPEHYNPVPAHAPGLPHQLGYLCPVSWSGRTKAYPRGPYGVVAMLAAPDPADDDGYPWRSYGPGRGCA